MLQVKEIMRIKNTEEKITKENIHSFKESMVEKERNTIFFISLFGIFKNN